MLFFNDCFVHPQKKIKKFRKKLAKPQGHAYTSHLPGDEVFETKIESTVRAVSSAVEHYLDMVGVTSSILVPPTKFCIDGGYFTVPAVFVCSGLTPKHRSGFGEFMHAVIECSAGLAKIVRIKLGVDLAGASFLVSDLPGHLPLRPPPPSQLCGDGVP